MLSSGALCVEPATAHCAPRRGQGADLTTSTSDQHCANRTRHCAAGPRCLKGELTATTQRTPNYPHSPHPQDAKRCIAHGRPGDLSEDERDCGILGVEAAELVGGVVCTKDKNELEYEQYMSYKANPQVPYLFHFDDSGTIVIVLLGILAGLVVQYLALATSTGRATRDMLWWPAQLRSGR